MSNRVMKDSEIEWIGEIPNHWGVKKIKHATEFVTCGVASTPVYAEKNDGGMFLSAQNVTKDNKLRLENASYIEKNLFKSLTKFRKVQKGDVLQVRVGGKSNIGQTCVVNVDISAAVYVSLSHIRVDKNFNNRFFSYYIQQKPFIEFALLDAQKTVGQANLNVSNLKNYKLLVPPLSKQEAIADYLDEKVWQLDRLIGDQQQVIEDWKTYKQSLITETVTKGLNPEVELKDSGIEWIGQIPSCWSVSKFSHIILDSNAGEVIPKDYWGNGDELLYTCSRQPLKSDFKDFPNWKRTNQGDLLLTRNATPYIHIPQKNSIYSNVVQRVSLKKVDTKFISYNLFIASDSMVGNGDIIESFNMEKWKNLRLALPPLHEQQAIADFLDEKCLKIDQLIEDKQHLIEDLKAYKQSLIYECVTGKKEIV